MQKHTQTHFKCRNLTLPWRNNKKVFVSHQHESEIIVKG